MGRRRREEGEDGREERGGREREREREMKEKGGREKEGVGRGGGRGSYREKGQGSGRRACASILRHAKLINFLC